jgi:hypothetical protein
MCLFAIPVGHQRGYQKPDDKPYQQSDRNSLDKLSHHKGYDQCRNDGDISSPLHP